MRPQYHRKSRNMDRMDDGFLGSAGHVDYRCLVFRHLCGMSGYGSGRNFKRISHFVSQGKTAVGIALYGISRGSGKTGGFSVVFHFRVPEQLTISKWIECSETRHKIGEEKDGFKGKRKNK